MHGLAPEAPSSFCWTVYVVANKSNYRFTMGDIASYKETEEFTVFAARSVTGPQQKRLVEFRNIAFFS